MWPIRMQNLGRVNLDPSSGWGYTCEWVRVCVGVRVSVCCGCVCTHRQDQMPVDEFWLPGNVSWFAILIAHQLAVCGEKRCGRRNWSGRLGQESEQEQQVELIKKQRLYNFRAVSCDPKHSFLPPLPHIVTKQQIGIWVLLMKIL